MPQNLTYALQITLIGMALVFGAIVLLWGLMLALVWLTGDRAANSQSTPETPIFPDHDLKQRAVAVAVTVALAQNAKPHHFPLPPTALVSAWQAVMRANQLNQKGPRR